MAPPKKADISQPPLQRGVAPGWPCSSALPGDPKEQQSMQLPGDALPGDGLSSLPPFYPRPAGWVQARCRDTTDHGEDSEPPGVVNGQDRRSLDLELPRQAGLPPPMVPERERSSRWRSILTHEDRGLTTGAGSPTPKSAGTPGPGSSEGGALPLPLDLSISHAFPCRLVSAPCPSIRS